MKGQIKRNLKRFMIMRNQQAVKLNIGMITKIAQIQMIIQVNTHLIQILI